MRTESVGFPNWKNKIVRNSLFFKLELKFRGISILATFFCRRQQHKNVSSFHFTQSIELFIIIIV